MKPIESKRVALDRRIVLRFPDFEGFVREYATNLSMTGMFVSSRDVQEPGTPVTFELRLEDGAPMVRGSGWVVWSRERPEAGDRPAGMGIEFTELDRKSRRLVRWMIQNQLPEGEAPFDVRAEAASGPGLAPTEGRSAIAGRRVIGFGLAVLILAALAAWTYRASTRGAGVKANREPTADVAPELAPETRPASGTGKEETIVEPPSPARPEAAAAATRAGTRVKARADGGSVAEAAALASVEDRVRSWARAWSEQDADRYLAHYASEFVPAGGLSRDEWKRQRRQRVTAPRSIRVAVTRVETRFLSETEARVSFLQTYRTDRYSDTVDKLLELELEDGVWKIRREIAD